MTICEKIEALRELQFDWDGCGAEPIHPKAIERALLFAQECVDGDANVVGVGPVENGSIKFESGYLTIVIGESDDNDGIRFDTEGRLNAERLAESRG